VRVKKIFKELQAIIPVKLKLEETHVCVEKLKLRYLPGKLCFFMLYLRTFTFRSSIQNLFYEDNLTSFLQTI